jgi:hypothetical protein
VSKSTYEALGGDGPTVNISMERFVFLVSPHAGCADGQLAMNSQQRKCGNFETNQEIRVSVFVPTAEVALASLTIHTDAFVKKVRL